MTLIMQGFPKKSLQKKFSKFHAIYSKDSDLHQIILKRLYCLGYKEKRYIYNQIKYT